MKYFLIILLLFCIGCAGNPVATPWCRHVHEYICTVVGEEYPVRIARGKANQVKDGYHVQAQYKPYDHWIWLGLNEFFEPIEDDRDDFRPFLHRDLQTGEMVFDYEYWTPQDYFDSRFRDLKTF